MIGDITKYKILQAWPLELIVIYKQLTLKLINFL